MKTRQTRNAIWTSILIMAFGVTFAFVANQKSVDAHCQVPCGIYDDEGRIKAMMEDVTTITKAIAQINELSGDMSPQNINQVIRWVNTKEEHASKIIETVSLYFLTQKVKPVAEGEEGHEKYHETLVDHHAVMRAAMTAKQKTDPEAATALKAAVEKLGSHYHSH